MVLNTTTGFGTYAQNRQKQPDPFSSPYQQPPAPLPMSTRQTPTPSVTIPEKINPVQQKPTTPVIPQAPAQPSYESILAELTTARTTAETQAKADRDALMKGQAGVLDTISKLGNKGTRYTEEYKELGGTEMEKNLQEANLRAASLESSFNRMIEENRNRPIQSTIIGGTQDRLMRQKAIEVGAVNSTIQAMQGNLSNARATAQKTVDLEFEPIETELKYKLQQLDLNYDLFTASEKKQADALANQLNMQLKQVEDQKAQKNEINEVMIAAAQNGADQQTVANIMKAKTKEEAILAASGATKITSPAGLVGLKESDIIRVGNDIYKKGTKGYLTETKDLTPKKVGVDASGNDLFFDPATNSVKTASQLSSTANLGNQVGTIFGLPSYDTRTANPGVTRSNRNNNPGNIKVSDYTKNFEGVIGVESNPASDGGNFLIFNSPDSGIAAIGRLLLEGKSYKGVTAEQAIKKYNGNGAYGAASVGLIPNQDFQSQIQDPIKLKEVATAIAKAEGYTVSSNVNNITDQIASDIFTGTRPYSEIDKLPKTQQQQVRNSVNTMKEKSLAEYERTGNAAFKFAATIGGKQLTQSVNDDIAKKMTVVSELKDLKTDIDKLNTGAFKGRILEKEFWNGDAATVRARIQGLIPTVARGVFSEVGVLTDTDIENYKKTIPDMKTPKDAVNTIYENLLTTIERQITNKLNTYANSRYDVSGHAEDYDNLMETITKIKDTGISDEDAQGIIESIMSSGIPGTVSSLDQYNQNLSSLNIPNRFQ